MSSQSPKILLEGATLDASVVGAITWKFLNNGQSCVCDNRI